MIDGLVRRFLIDCRTPQMCSICETEQPFTAGNPATGKVVCAPCVAAIIRDGHALFRSDPSLLETLKAAAVQYFAGRMLAGFLK